MAALGLQKATRVPRQKHYPPLGRAAARGLRALRGIAEEPGIHISPFDATNEQLEQAALFIRRLLLQRRQ